MRDSLIKDKCFVSASKAVPCRHGMLSLFPRSRHALLSAAVGCLRSWSAQVQTGKVHPIQAVRQHLATS